MKGSTKSRLRQVSRLSVFLLGLGAYTVSFAAQGGSAKVASPDAQGGSAKVVSVNAQGGSAKVASPAAQGGSAFKTANQKLECVESLTLSVDDSC